MRHLLYTIHLRLPRHTSVDIIPVLYKAGYSYVYPGLFDDEFQHLAIQIQQRFIEKAVGPRKRRIKLKNSFERPYLYYHFTNTDIQEWIVKVLDGIVPPEDIEVQKIERGEHDVH